MSQVPFIDPSLPTPCLSFERPNALAALLSGPQKKKKKEKEIEVKNPNLLFTDEDSYFLEHKVLELEKKVYGNVKPTSLSQILGRKKHTPAPELDDTDPDIHQEPVDIADLESKIHSKSTRVSARNIFASFKPTYMVTLRITPLRLEEIHNPFRTKGLNSKGVSFMLVMRRLTKVTFKISPERLREIHRSSNPLHTKSSGPKTGRSARLVFDMMMTNATAPKTNKFYKLKELMPPEIQRDQMHVYMEEALPPRALNLPQRARQTVLLEGIFEYPSTSCSGDVSPYLYTNTIPPEVAAPTNVILSRIYTQFVAGTAPLVHWPSDLQPTKCQDILTTLDNQTHLQTWVINAFARLKAQALTTPRNVLLKQRKKKQLNEFNSFIVDDGDETDDDIFVPLLIVHGHTGSGKSSAVYAAMREINGYVHEINAGVARGRKDVYASLRELCTTQLVHPADDTRQFQKGIVLLEDCDLLFEQDKQFWPMVNDIINILRRPIVITCLDPGVIPRNVWEYALEEDAIVCMNQRLPEMDELVKQYLRLCGLAVGCDLRPSVLGHLVDGSPPTHHDIRDLLLRTHQLCKRNTSVEYAPPPAPAEPDTVAALAHQLEVLSACDVIESNSHTPVRYPEPLSEITDIYHIDDHAQLRLPLGTHEFNPGRQIKEELPTRSQPNCLFTFNELREDVLDFVGSRRKRSTWLERATRSGGDYDPGPVGVSELSYLHAVSKTPFTTEVAGIARIWHRFQKALTAKEEEMRPQNVSVKKFLGWRDFDVDSPILASFKLPRQ